MYSIFRSSLVPSYPDQVDRHALDGGPAVRRFDRNRQEIEAIRCVGNSANPQTKGQREAPSRMADRRTAMVTGVNKVRLRDRASRYPFLQGDDYGQDIRS
jgi:hypothetical protein